MSIWGALIGGAAGFAIGGPLGALLGAAAGHAVERAGQQAGLIEGARPASGPERDNTRHIAFTIGVIALGAKMAKADGRVTRDEVDAFKRVFKVPPGETHHVARVFNMARQDSAGYEPYARQIAGLFNDRPAVLEELLLCLFYIAKADGKIHADELAYLKNVATIFGFDDATFDRIRASEIGADPDDPYTALGVTRDTDDESLKKAYHELAREHHPDRLVAQGMPAEFVEVADRRLAAINAAYDRIRAERGLK
ncbi:MAG: TerB family tellurite resistance protein [Pseudomonadota bacterium]